MKPAPKKSKFPMSEVYGLLILVKLRKEPEGQPEVLCPKGGTLFYGEVVGTGDGYDTDAKAFRRMPPLGAVVTFEESGDHVEGHYFFMNDEEYRVIHLDSVIVSFPQADETAS